MHYLKTKAYKICKLIVEWELYRMILKYVIKNNLLPFWLRQYALYSLLLLPLQSSQVYIHLRCYMSNQPRSLLSFFKLNRVRFKFMTSQAQLTGIKKSIW